MSASVIAGHSRQDHAVPSAYIRPCSGRRRRGFSHPARPDRNLCMPKGDTASLRVQYEELGWSLCVRWKNQAVLFGTIIWSLESAAYQLGWNRLLCTVMTLPSAFTPDRACFADSAAVETFLSDRYSPPAPGPALRQRAGSPAAAGGGWLGSFWCASPA